MSQESVARDGVEVLLESPRWELLPFESFEEQHRQVPSGQTITITASPDKGIEPTIDLAVETAEETSYNIVPHLAARAIRDREQLGNIVDRIQDAGITDIFVPGGDNETPVGEFDSAHDLLIALDELGYEFDEVGITGYPEGHPIISNQELRDATERKREYATYIVTQICYDPEAVIAWIEETRDQGIELPVYVGLPGVMNYQRLLGISRKVGVGDSLKFIRKTSGILATIKRMIGSRGVYKPDELIDGLAPHATDERLGIAGLHAYTFNRVEDTASWRKDRLS